MKRRINSVLQRKRTEFEGARDTRRPSRFSDPDEAVVIQLKDGYDWLVMIKGTQASIRTH